MTTSGRMSSAAQNMSPNPGAMVASPARPSMSRLAAHCALEVLDRKAGIEALLAHLLATELLDMQLLNARAQDANPLLRPPEVNGVADVELPARGGAVQFIHKAGGFERAEQEMVPDILEGHLRAQFLGERHGFAERFLCALVSGGVGDLLADAAGHDQDGRGAVTLGVPQGLLDALDRLVAFRGVRLGNAARVLAATDAGNGQAGGVARAQDFILAQVAVRFDAVEAGGLGGLELLQDCLAWRRGIPDALLQVAFHGRFRRPVSWRGGRRGL